MQKPSEIFCLSCRTTFKNDCDFDKHPCNPIFKMVQGSITVELSHVTGLKRTRWGRFKQRFSDLDFGFGLAFMGLLIMNYFFICNMNLTFTEALIEGLAWGFAIPRLLK